LDTNFSDDKVSDTRVKKRDLAYKLTFEVLPVVVDALCFNPSPPDTDPE